MSHFSIQPARQDDLPYLKKHLKQALIGEPPSRFWVARQNETGKTIGAVSLRHLRGKEGNRHYFLISVDEGERRKGIGTALLQEIVTQARQQNSMILAAGKNVSPESGEATFFESRQFQVVQRRTYFETTVANYAAVFERKASKISDTGLREFPGQIVTLDKADTKEVIALLLSQLGGIADIYKARIQDPAHGYLPDVSFVGIINGRVAGAILGRKQEDSVHVDVFATYPPFRGHWLPQLLMRSVFDFCNANGVPTVYYEADSDLHPTTVDLAQKVGGKAISEKLIYGRKFDG